MIVERRRHYRIITWKHCASAFLVGLAVLVGFNIHSELRAPRGNEYGRPEPVVQQVSTRAPEVVVTEGVIPSGSEGPGGQGGAITPSQIPRSARGDSRIAIVGDADGVTITTPTHHLRGGFGRP